MGFNIGDRDRRAETPVRVCRRGPCPRGTGSPGAHRHRRRLQRLRQEPLLRHQRLSGLHGPVLRAELPEEGDHLRGGRQSKIDPDLCVNCGRCVDMCPFHAIVRVPVPCEEALPSWGLSPVGDSGKQTLDHEGCVHCGKCMQACPFGAIVVAVGVPGDPAGPREKRGPPWPSSPRALLGQFEASPGATRERLEGAGFQSGGRGGCRSRSHHGSRSRGTDRAPGGGGSLHDEPPAVRPTRTWFARTCPPWRRASPTRRPPLHFTAEMAAARFPEALRVFISPWRGQAEGGSRRPIGGSRADLRGTGRGPGGQGRRCRSMPRDRARAGGHGPGAGLCHGGGACGMPWPAASVTGSCSGPTSSPVWGRICCANSRSMGPGRASGTSWNACPAKGAASMAPAWWPIPGISRRKLEATLKESGIAVV